MSRHTFTAPRVAAECDFDADHHSATVRITGTYRGRAFTAQVCRRCARTYAPDGPATPAERAWFAQVCGEFRLAMPIDVPWQPGRRADAVSREPLDGRR